MSRQINPDQVAALLDAALCGSMAEAARRVGVSPSTPWRWLVQSRMGHPDLQDITFCDVGAPFHVHYDKNLPALMAAQVQQTAFERARDGVMVDVFFQGVRMTERVLKAEYASIPEDELWLEVGPEWETICYETRPTKQWLKPSDALVVKMLEAWNRKRYGAHQTVDVNYGGVLRLERDAPAKPVIDATPAVFEDVDEAAVGEARGGHLALAPPAKDSADFDARAAAGEFDPAVVTFRDADGNMAALRPDIEELREQAAALKRDGPINPRPNAKVEVFKASDEPRVEPPPPPSSQKPPQTLADHPRAYEVPKSHELRRPMAHSEIEAGPTYGEGRERIGTGPDPRRGGGVKMV